MKNLRVSVVCAAVSGAVVFFGCAGVPSADICMESNDGAVMRRAKSFARSETVMADAAAPAMGMTAAANRSSYFQPQKGRMIAYTAGFTVSVKIRDAAMEELKKLAESCDGYLVSRSRGSMVLKVPSGKADEFMKKAGDIGKVTDFHISADDLTDSITDTGVRLDNMKKLRTRLTELLAKAKNVEEMLKVERELNRVTTDIERLEAQLKNSLNRVNFVRFTVQIVEEHGSSPGGNPKAVNHFPFLRKLSRPEAGTEDKPLFGIALPDGMVPMISCAGECGGVFSATSSDDCIFRLWSVEVPDDSTLDFWGKMVCRALECFRSYDNLKIVPVEFQGSKALKITGQVTTSDGVQQYMAVISLKSGFFSSELRIVEFFGPEAAFAGMSAAVTGAIHR